MRTTKEIYDFYKVRVYRLWAIRDNKKRDSLIGTPQWSQYYGWDSWHKIEKRFRREYDRAQHREHIAEGKDGCYLWCNFCRITATKECSKCRIIKLLYFPKERVCFDCAFPQYANIS